MIITHTRNVRSFIGNLSRGSDLLESIRGICVDNTILCALLSGSGYLSSPTMRTYSAKTLGYGEPTTYEGTLHLVSMQGNISLAGTDTNLCIHACGMLEDAEGNRRFISGELLSAPVLNVEFGLSVVDTVRLYRGTDSGTGLEPWLHLDLSDGPLRVPELPQDQPRNATARAAGKEEPLEKAISLEDAEVTEGDWLEHPTLGSCQVVEFDGEGRVTIRLGSGRLVELHLGLLDLRPSANAPDGSRKFGVSIKRRKRAK